MISSYKNAIAARAPKTPHLEQLLQSLRGGSSVNVRAWAADQLGLGPYEPSEVVPALVLALKDKDPEVARLAALALGRKRHPSALPALREALAHPDPRVSEAARAAIAGIE